MVGQLLLHHPTTGAMARDREGNEVDLASYSTNKSQASCFCYVGACKFVYYGLNLGNPPLWYLNDLDHVCDEVLGKVTTGDDWDNATDKQRKRWAIKLANYQG